MASIKRCFTQALMTIKSNNKGILMNTAEDWFEVSYDDLRDMLSDAQLLNHLGYNTRMNRKMFLMSVSMGM
jgi:predicted neutral ceramidase superfamily lipid hydrolase